MVCSAHGVKTFFFFFVSKAKSFLFPPSPLAKPSQMHKMGSRPTSYEEMRTSPRGSPSKKPLYGDLTPLQSWGSKCAPTSADLWRTSASLMQGKCLNTTRGKGNEALTACTESCAA